MASDSRRLTASARPVGSSGENTAARAREDMRDGADGVLPVAVTSPSCLVGHETVPVGVEFPRPLAR